MREPGGTRSLRRRLGIGATLALGVGLTVAAAQSALVDATPATVSAAEDAEFGQTRVANEATRSSAQPLRSVDSTPAGVACGYPDNCDHTTDTGSETGDPPPALPTSRDCDVSDFGPLDESPYLSVTDDCAADRALLDAAQCTLTETVGIGDDTYRTDEAALQMALANRGLSNTSRYQLYTCPGGVEVTLTSELPPM